MPELPEVETVRRGLAPAMEGARFHKVRIGRPDLRFPLPQGFQRRLEGVRVNVLGRRGKYLTADLSSGETLIMHLGMSGRFTVEGASMRQRAAAVGANPKHDHVVFKMARGDNIEISDTSITYNDPRRFGFMDLAATSGLEECRHFKGMGPEPLGNGFSAAALNQALKGKTAPIKAALLDQRVVAGLGNIYVSEALYRAKVSPRRRAASVAGRRGERLYHSIIEVLRDAIEAGGSTLRDFAAADGELGYFQHRFDVYDREGEACRHCSGAIARLTQAGRSTYFCPSCQR